MNLETFFLQTPLGLENQVAIQLKQFSKVQIYPGGIEVECTLQQGLALNCSCKSITRVLWRCGRFKAKDFPALFQRIQKIPWRMFVERGSVEFQASAHASRLKIKSRIEDTCKRAYESFHRGHEPKANSSTHQLQVYVRLEDDIATVSVNTSGEPLYRRGIKIFNVDAPLRENIAAILLQSLTHHLPIKRDLPVLWIDPMAGSGTFLLEALSMKSLSEARSYDFEKFPIVREQLPAVKSLAQDFLQQNPLVSDSFLSETFFAWDESEKAVAALQKNLRQFDGFIQQVDVFKNETKKFSDKQKGILSHSYRIVISNPPFGERLSVPQKGSSYYLNILNAQIKLFNPHMIGLLVPVASANFTAPSEYKQRNKLEFSHGGLKVAWLIFQKAD